MSFVNVVYFKCIDKSLVKDSKWISIAKGIAKCQYKLFCFTINLNSLNTNDKFSCLGGPGVTLEFWCERSRFRFPTLAMIFKLFVLCWPFNFVCPKHIICIESVPMFCNINIFHILNMLQNVWPIIISSRYTTRILQLVYKIKKCIVNKA